MIAAALLCLATTTAFQRAPTTPLRRSPLLRSTRANFEVEVMLEGASVKAELSPTMANSELVVAQYPLPFFIDIENAGQKGSVVTKDGSEQENKGVERVGDRLRAFTYYEVGQSLDAGGGVVSMFGGFGGAGIKYRRKLFDATFVSWEKSLETLCTNEPRRTDSVTMIFERNLDA